MTGSLDPKWHRRDRVATEHCSMHQLEPLLSAQDLANFLDVPIATIYSWRYRREGPPGFRVGRYLRYQRSDVEQWIADRLQQTGLAERQTAVPNPHRRNTPKTDTI